MHVILMNHWCCLFSCFFKKNFFLILLFPCSSQNVVSAYPGSSQQTRSTHTLWFVSVNSPSARGPGSSGPPAWSLWDALAICLCWALGLHIWFYLISQAGVRRVVKMWPWHPYAAEISDSFFLEGSFCTCDLSTFTPRPMAYRQNFSRSPCQRWHCPFHQLGSHMEETQLPQFPGPSASVKTLIHSAGAVNEHPARDFSGPFGVAALPARLDLGGSSVYLSPASCAALLSRVAIYKFYLL